MIFLNRLQQWIGVLPQRKVLNCLIAVLAIVSCQQLAQLTLRLIPSNSSDLSIIANASVANLQSDGAILPTINITAIQQLELFGKTPVNQTAVEDIELNNQGEIGQYDSAPNSPLNVKLKGVISSEHQELSLAIIADGAKQLGHSVGDVIFNTQARVVQIMPDRVIIQRQGRYEALKFDDEDDAQLNLRRQSVTSGRTSASDDYTQTTAINNDSVNEIKEKLQLNPAGFLDYLSISPVMEAGSLAGYRLNSGRDAELFKQVGLQANDLAIAINGFDLREPEEAQKIIQQLGSLTSIAITIVRNGQLQEIQIVLDEE